MDHMQLLTGGTAWRNCGSRSLKHSAPGCHDKMLMYVTLIPIMDILVFPGWAIPTWPGPHLLIILGFYTHEETPLLPCTLLCVSGSLVCPGLLWCPLPLRTHPWAPALLTESSYRPLWLSHSLLGQCLPLFQLLVPTASRIISTTVH